VKGALAPFSYPLFRRVWAASTASNLGGMIQTVGAAWLMLALTGSPRMVALVQASVALPVVLFSLAAGAVADNLDRRRVMLAAQVFLLAIAAMLALVTWLGHVKEGFSLMASNSDLAIRTPPEAR
jgi:MFS family permease